MSELTDQLVDELRRTIADPARTLLGPTIADRIEDGITLAAPMLAAQLTGDDDLAGQTALDLMLAIWPHGSPDIDWWGTPLGRSIARTYGENGDSVSYSVAAALLRVSVGSVKTMVARTASGKGGGGGLERHPDGGVTRASVMARLARG